MAKHFWTFEHTADVGLSARADTLGELFEALADGLAGYIAKPGRLAKSQSRHLVVKAEDVEALAVDYLSEVLRIIQADHFMVASARALEIDEHHIRAELLGETFDPTRHTIDHEVKAVTYHQLKVAQEGGQWAASVILDI